MSKPIYNTPEPCGANRKAIAGLAETILKHYKLQPGADLDSFVSRIGGEVAYLDDQKDASQQASIQVEDDGSFVIRLSRHLFPLQRRVSIAHELGHLFLHALLHRTSLQAFHDSSLENELAENEADEFARAFLMPTAELNKLIEHTCDSTNIAAHFFVPEPFARQQLRRICK